MLQSTPQITFKPLARISDHKKDKVLPEMFFGREQITHILYDPEALLSHSPFFDFMCKKKQNTVLCVNLIFHFFYINYCSIWLIYISHLCLD